MNDALKRKDFAVEIVRRLRGAGFQALWAGGCVRDLLLGATPADYDVATSATPEEVMALLPYHAITVGVAFGVVRVLHPVYAAVEVEVATFRSDSAYVDGRRPESVVFSSPQRDAERRDFTINGMFMDPFTEKVIDYVGGRADLENRRLRAIGNPADRLREDKLRALRAVRLAARFALQIEPATLAALRSMAPEVVTVSAERIAQELRRMLVHESRAEGMKLAFETGLVAAILPPLTALKGPVASEPPQVDLGLWDHTMRVLELLPSKPSFPLAVAALLHEAGKPSSKELREGSYTFPNYELASVRIAEGMCRALKLSNAERERIIWLVANHRYLDEATTLRASKLKKILAEPGIEDLLELHRAIALASGGSAEQVDYCRHYIAVEPAGPINPPPLVTGDDLVRHGLEPGPRFATLLNQLRDAQLDGLLQSRHEALEWVDRQVAAGVMRSPDRPCTDFAPGPEPRRETRAEDEE
jgi:poly(A) polymerase